VEGHVVVAARLTSVVAVAVRVVAVAVVHLT
jgi:hypothetical protein